MPLHPHLYPSPLSPSLSPISIFTRCPMPPLHPPPSFPQRPMPPPLHSPPWRCRTTALMFGLLSGHAPCLLHTLPPRRPPRPMPPPLTPAPRCRHATSPSRPCLGSTSPPHGLSRLHLTLRCLGLDPAKSLHAPRLWPRHASAAAPPHLHASAEPSPRLLPSRRIILSAASPGSFGHRSTPFGPTAKPPRARMPRLGLVLDPSVDRGAHDANHGHRRVQDWRCCHRAGQWREAERNEELTMGPTI